MKTLILPPRVTQEATQSEEAGYKETVINFSSEIKTNVPFPQEQVQCL